MPKQHNYDHCSVEEIIRSAQKTGLKNQEISDRLGLPSIQLLKWLLDLNNYNRRYDYDPSNPPILEVEQERLDYLADYCRTQGIFPIISTPESAESPQGRNNTFKEQMIISWKKFLKQEYRHPTSAELINQLEKEAIPLSGITVDKNLRKITINGHSRRYGASSEPFEQSYRRLKKQMLDQ